MQTHLRMEEQEHIAAGISPEEVYRTAARHFLGLLSMASVLAPSSVVP
jgi:hypothetical protein